MDKFPWQTVHFELWAKAAHITRNDMNKSAWNSHTAQAASGNPS